MTQVGHDKVGPSHRVGTGPGVRRRFDRLVVEVLVVGRVRLEMSRRSLLGLSLRRPTHSSRQA